MRWRRRDDEESTDSSISLLGGGSDQRRGGGQIEKRVGADEEMVEATVRSFIAGTELEICGVELATATTRGVSERSESDEEQMWCYSVLKNNC
ncbi:hypothetical protein Drorol1_Dr00026025 [Drosera rotundifolia]